MSGAGTCWSARAVLLMGALLMTAACFTDFDRFKNVEAPDGEPDVVEPEPDVDEPEPDVVEPEPEPEPDVVEDIDEPDVEDEPDVDEPDVEDEPDVDEPDPVAIGGECLGDGDCPEGLQCRLEIEGGLCTLSCDVDDDCPEGAACGAENDFGYCLETCDDARPCAREGMGPGALTCRPWFDDGQQVCIQDNDEDRVLNLADNCVEVPNLDQRDADQDGEGDACDETVQCPGGVLVQDEPIAPTARPEPPRALLGGAFLYVDRLRKALYLGGEDTETGEPVSRIDAYDIDERTWGPSGLPPLPFASRNLSVAFDTFRRELVATPGEGPNGPPVDRLILLDVDSPAPGWRLGPQLPEPLRQARIQYVFPHHLIIVGYGAPVEGSAALKAFSYDRLEGSLDTLEGEFLVPLDQARAPLVESQLNGLSYTLIPDAGQRDTLFIADPLAGTFTELQLGFNLFFERNDENFPMLSFRGPLDILYYMSTDNGDIEKIFVLEPQVQNTSYELVVPDQGDVDPEAVQTQAVYLAETASLLSVVTQPGVDDAPQTQATEHFMRCFNSINFAIFNKDQDIHPDLVDNCVGIQNNDQADLDGDGLGDVCDDDIDGDEIPNDEDVAGEGDDLVDLSLDTDNDGQPNLQDLDDDGDRIEDREDPYPLDSDNDRLPNAFDEDDDGDLFSDDRELRAESNPTDVLSVPGGDRLTFVSLEGEVSSLVVTTTGALGDGGPLEVVEIGGAVPKWPRLVPDRGLVVFTDISAQVPAIVIEDLEGVLETITGEVPGLISNAVDIRPSNEVEELVVVRIIEDDGGPREVIERVVVSTLGGELQTLPVFGEEGPALAFTGLDVADDADALIYGAGPAGCDICADLSRQALPVGFEQRLDETDLGLTEAHPRLSDEGFSVLFLAGTPGAMRAYVLAVGEDVPQAVSPEGLHINSADFAPDTRRVVLSARPVGEPEAPYRLLLRDRVLDRTWILTGDGASALEVSFAR